MCTALQHAASDRILFGRNMDIPVHFGEQPIYLPTAAPIPTVASHEPPRRYAILGMGSLIDGYPAYADAFNAAGLAGAALNFPGFATLGGRDGAAVTLPPYHLLLWCLGRFSSVEEIAQALPQVVLSDRQLRPDVPLPTLHWMFSDKNGRSIVVEWSGTGPRIFENPVQVMANAPTFDWQLTNLRRYLTLNSAQPSGTDWSALSLSPLGYGDGAAGLPGDFSSVSRFVRVAFFRAHLPKAAGAAAMADFFAVLQNVAMVPGSVLTERGTPDRTIYSCCMDLTDSIYFFTTAENRRITAIYLHNCTGDKLTAFPLSASQDITAI